MGRDAASEIPSFGEGVELAAQHAAHQRHPPVARHTLAATEAPQKPMPQLRS